MLSTLSVRSGANTTGAAMTRQQLLTLGWNNALTLGLGLPTLAFAVVALATPLMTGKASFIGMSVIGALF